MGIRKTTKPPKERHKNRLIIGGMAVVISAMLVGMIALLAYDVYEDAVMAWSIATGGYLGLIVLSYIAGYILVDLPDDLERWRGGGDER